MFSCFSADIERLLSIKKTPQVILSPLAAARSVDSPPCGSGGSPRRTGGWDNKKEGAAVAAIHNAQYQARVKENIASSARRLF